MVLLTLSLLLAAEPEAELKLATPGLTTTGIEASLAAPLTEHLARAITGIRVVTPRDISALLGLERQKALLGCTENATECMAELGNALGVQGVVLGDLVKLGDSVQINVRVIDPVAGKELARASARVEEEEDLFDALTRVGKQLSSQVLVAFGRAPAAAPPPLVQVSTRKGSRRFFPIPFVAGGVALAAGIAFLVLSEGDWQRLTAGKPESVSPGQAILLAREGQLFQVVGATLVTVGAVAAVGGMALLLFGSERGGTSPVASLGLAPNGLVVAGRF